MTARSFEESIRLLNDRINLERLRSFTSKDMEGRLETLQQILTSLGNPETAFQTVHVAGTKGKGSTCVMLESILREEGWRVGLFTSPHLYSFTERLVINGKPITPEEFTELFFSVYEQIEPDILQALTYFELLTLLAFVFFARQKVDVAIFEVGLGGRLDSTNVCRPHVSVITSISYEHIMQLGPTLSDITAEKCGIMKPGVPVVTTVLHPAAQNIIQQKARSIGSPLFALNEHFFVRHSMGTASTQYTFRFEALLPKFPVELTLDDVSLQMPGSHQIRNASAALSAFLLLHQNRKTFDAERIRVGLQNSFLPLRIEVIHRSANSPTFIFDGAHNRSSIQALIKTVERLFPNLRLLLIFGISLGKDAEGMFAEISGHFHHIFLTQYSDSNRRFPPKGLRSVLALNPDIVLESEPRDDDEPFLTPSIRLNPFVADAVTFPLDLEQELDHVTIEEDCKSALAKCIQMAEKRDVICITGSLYLAAELRECFLDGKNYSALAGKLQ